jgi:transcriptional regulator with XRE-family HTH domain
MSSDTSRDLGARLRAWRRARGWRIADISEKTGLAISTISKVENGQMSLTYDKLMQLVTGLPIDLAELFEPQSAVAGANGVVLGRRSVDRASDAHHISAGFYDYWYLNTDLARKRMTPILGETRAPSLEEFGELIRHPGEEFVYVLSGVLVVHTEFYSPTVLKPGETIYIDSNMGHAYIAGDGKVCRFLCVCVGDRTEDTVQAIRTQKGATASGEKTRSKKKRKTVRRG